MATTSIEILKTWFETGDKPTQAQFENLIDSFHHIDAGTIITDNQTDGSGITLTLSDGSQLVIPIYSLPPNMPISFITDLQSSLDAKVDKVAGKQLSTNDFTAVLKAKLDGLVNYVHPALHQISEVNGLQALLDSYAILANLHAVAISGDFDDLTNKPRAKKYIDGYWVDTTGNTDINAIEVNNIITKEDNGLFVYKVNALPHTTPANLTPILENAII
ncbi:MAG: hypothetical protein PSN34_06240 [Urechidicola sp.]|nr:hypothetical protein [Urechidicola sp.]